MISFFLLKNGLEREKAILKMSKNKQRRVSNLKYFFPKFLEFLLGIPGVWFLVLLFVYFHINVNMGMSLFPDSTEQS